jgi:hypothetical protein
VSDTQFEKSLIRALKWELNNRKFKSENLLEWSTSEDAVRNNLKESEGCIFVLGVWCAFQKSCDLRVKGA